jgi:hypothetical protein
MSGAVPPLSHKSQLAQGQFYLHFCIMNCYGLSPFSFVSLLPDHSVYSDDTGKPIAGKNFLPFLPRAFSISISLFFQHSFGVIL